MKKNNKTHISPRSFTTLATVVASSLLLASCGGGDSTGSTTTDSLSAASPTARAQAVARGTVPTGWVGRMPLPTIVHPTASQITTLNGIKIFNNVLTVHIPKANQQAAYQKIISKKWTVLSKNYNFHQINIADTTKDSIEDKISTLKETGLFDLIVISRIIGGNVLFSNPDPSLSNKDFYNYDSIKIKPAWDLVKAESTKNDLSYSNIGVIDKGIGQNVDDLTYKAIFNKISCGTFLCDDHGYHVSGIIAAEGNNGKGHVGVGSGSTNYQNLYGGGVSETTGLTSIQNLIDAGSKVINVSLASYEIDQSAASFSQEIFDAISKSASDSSKIIRKAFSEQMNSTSNGGNVPDVLFVQSSGNIGAASIPNTSTLISNYYSGIFNAFIEDHGADEKYKYFYDRILIVGAYDEYKNIWNNTQRPHSKLSSDRFILAPGVNIYSNILTKKLFVQTNGVDKKTGTSMAAPHVVGVASLILQVNKNLTAKEVADIILETADSSLGTPYKNRTPGDGSNVYRYLNAEAAVKEAIARKKCGSISSPSIVGQLGPYYTATAERQTQFATIPAPKPGYPFGSYTWTTSDSSATLVNNGGTLADFVLNTAGTTTVTVTPVLTDGTVCTSSAATAQVNVQAVSVPAPSVSIEMSQTGLGFAGATGIGSYDYLSSLTSGIGKPAVKFNGGKFLVPNNPNMQFTDGATFDVWLRLDSMTGMDGWGNTGTNGHYAGTIIAKSHDRTGGALMVNGFGDTWVATYDPTWEKENCTRFFSASVPNGVWFRSTITLSPTTGMKGYTNKTLSWACQPSNMSFATMNSQDLYIGRFSDYWFPIPGAIADIKIYKSALTAAQISQLN